MAAVKASQLIALRNLSRSNRQLLRCRPLSTLEQSKRSRAEQSRAPAFTRQFTTDRRLQARGDDSTIDFMYFPEDLEPEEVEVYRVPILPDNYSTTENTAGNEDDVVMKAEISTTSADAVFMPMAESSDGHAMNIDFHAMADKVAANVRELKIPVEEQASMMKQIWSDMIDDMLALNKKKSSGSN